MRLTRRLRLLFSILSVISLAVSGSEQNASSTELAEGLRTSEENTTEVHNSTHGSTTLKRETTADLLKTDDLSTHASQPKVEETREKFEPLKFGIQNESQELDFENFTSDASTEVTTDITDFSSNVTEECPADSLLPCVTKCCPFGQTLTSNNRQCKPSRVRFIPQFTILVNGFNDTNPINETEKMDKYNLIIQNMCLNNRYRIDPVDSQDEFHLLFNGSLWMPNTKPVQTLIPSSRFCMEVFTLEDEEKILPVVCFPDSNEILTSSFHFIVYPIGLLVSVPFLLATFLVYNLIPELRDLHGKTLSCYVICLMVAYILLSTVQLGNDVFEDKVCVGLAFAIQFSFLACFFWLNVLCFNTWRNVIFHGDISHQLPAKKQRSYFLFYSIYAWTCTIILIVVTMVMNFEPTIPSSYLKPTIGVKTCWFNTQEEAVPYFYGPVAALLVINVLLFITTAIKLICDHRNKPPTDRKPRETVHLCLSLFFMMGINWLLELISWAAGGPPFIWYITDICNTLQGIFIFIVFVMDRQVRKKCQDQLLPRLRACLPCRKKTEAPQHRVMFNGSEVYMTVPAQDEHTEHDKYKFG